MRTRITLACTECKQRNYNTTKDKKTHPDRMEIKKYCIRRRSKRSQVEKGDIELWQIQQKQIRKQSNFLTA